VLLLGEGSRCLGSVFVSLEHCRRMLLLEESCGRSFLIPYGRVCTNDQSKQTTGVNGLLTFVFWHRALSSNFWDVSVCLTRGRIDWKGGVRNGFILPLG
jgi:hypothetical protein